MALTEIEYGALASSAVLNNNFQYLQDKISELSTLITTETSSFSSTVATLNKSISALLEAGDSFIPTGAIISYQSDEIPSGFLICDGSELKISEYEKLYDVIGTTFGQTDSTTFCIPNLQGRVIQGTNSSDNLGKYFEAGLPNISGYLTGTHGTAYGAFSSSAGAYRPGGSGVSDRQAGITYNASWSNGIYGKSSTVQPPAMATNFLIKY